MEKWITDMHTHTAFSYDGKDAIEKMLAAAQEKGVAFYGISEHFDFDYDLRLLDAKTASEIYDCDAEEYFHRARHCQEDYEGVMNVCIGGEFGYSEDEKAQARYLELYQKYKPDFVINSVHGDRGKDFAFTDFTEPKERTYKRYLQLVRQSLDVPYPYDVVGHIGYIARYVPFEDKRISLEEFGAELDDIFKTIIAKDKILEVNTATKQLPNSTLPEWALIERYYALGGRKISYGSDAHFAERIADKREETVARLKQIGFEYVTVPCKGEHIKVRI